MARKINKRDNRYLAKLVTGKKAPCAFCLREVDDEATFGKLYAIGDIQCHYFCCLLSCCLIQKGHDEEGLFGFLYTDIITEIKRCKKHKCSYCGKSGANLGCSVGACRKQFHLPCGREKSAVSLYYGTYKSFCKQHAPRQKIPEHIMGNARLRMKLDKVKRSARELDTIGSKTSVLEGKEDGMVCVICYEAVDGFPTNHTFWPPCCARDAWFHRSCLQRMALTAGMHYLKCPLCNDKENFYEAVVSQGYYVPDRDAAWELEQNAFAEIYERPVTCCAENCRCPKGREHDAETGEWDIKLCLLCGSEGIHINCLDDQSQSRKIVASTVDQSQLRTHDDSVSLSELQTENETVTGESQMHCKALAIDQRQQAIDIDALPVDQSQNAINSDAMVVDQSQKAIDCDALPVDQSQKGIDCDALPVDQSQKAIDSDALPDDQSQKGIDCDALPVDQSQKAIHSDAMVVDQSQKAIDNDEFIVDQSQKATDSDNLALDQSNASFRYVCRSCLPAAPENLDALATSIEAIIQKEQEESVTNARRPVMLSRMSLRRTKTRQAILNEPSNSRSNHIVKVENDSSESQSVQTSRRELNLKTPRKLLRSEQAVCNNSTGDKLMSPIKLIEQSFKEKMSCTGVRDAVLDETVIEKLRRKFRKPRPLCAKKRIVNDILDGLFDNLMKDASKQEQLKEWCSPKKCYEIKKDSEGPQADISESSNIPEKNIKIEKEFNTPNTPPKKTDSIKDIVSKDEQVSFTNNNENDTNNNENTSNDNGNQTELDIEETPTRNNNETCRKTRNSASKVINNNEYLNIENAASSEELNISEDKQAFSTVKPKKLYKKLSLKICTSKKNKRKTSNIVNKCNNEINIQVNNNVSIGPNIVSNNGSIQKYEDENDIYSESSTSAEDKSKQGCSILRQLLIENNDRSKTLSEITTDPIIKNNSDETTKPLTESADINTLCSSDPPRDLAETSKDLAVTLKDLAETSKDLAETSKDIAETSKNLTQTPKRKTIDIQHDSSLEISENDQSINIDVIKIDDSLTCEETYKQFQEKFPDKIKTCCFKFSPLDKETLEKKDLGGIDLESFKKEYLHEVDREFKCNFSHKHVNNAMDETRLRTAIDFAVDAAIKKETGAGAEISAANIRKRKLSESGLRLIFDDNDAKKRKLSESDLNLSYDHNKPENIETISVDDSAVIRKSSKKKMKKERKRNKDKRKLKKNKRSCQKNIEVTIDSSEKRRGKNKKKKIKTKFAIQNENIHVKIKWKKKQLSLNIESKKQAKKEKKENRSKFKQYVLQFPEGSNDVLAKPEKEVCPIKRKYVKQDKTPDKLKQMSIHSFFTLKSPGK